MTKPADHFNKDAARFYDERNRHLLPISDCMHFLIKLALEDMPSKSHILCVGVGTGAEIMHLSKSFPEWTFVDVDPSASMLEVCAERFAAAGLSDRCQLIHGYVDAAPEGENFDAVLSILVGHFVKREEKLDFFQNMTQRLKPGGHLVNTEIGFDLDSNEYPDMLNYWGKVQGLMGATPQSLANLPNVLRSMLNILPHPETVSLLQQSGIPNPVRVFQAFMIAGWIGRKP